MDIFVPHWASYLTVLLCGFLLGRWNKKKLLMGSSKSDCSQPRTALHFAYVVGILLALIIALITIEWSEVEGLLSYLNFASTVSSLLLALVAVGYAVFTQSSAMSALTSVKKVSTDLERVANSISASNLELTDKVEGTSTRIRDFEQKVDRHFENSQRAIKEVSQRSMDHSGDDVARDADLTINDLADQILNVASISGLESLYIATLSFKTKTAFEYENITSDKELFESGFAKGFLGACESVSLIDLEVDANKRNVTKNINPKIAEKVSGELLRRTRKVARELSSNGKIGISAEEAFDIIAASVHEISKYFGENSDWLSYEEEQI